MLLSGALLQTLDILQLTSPMHTAAVFELLK